MGCNKLFGQFVIRGFKTIPADLGIYAISHYFLTTLIRRLPVLERRSLVGEVSRRDALRGMEGISRKRLVRKRYPNDLRPARALAAHANTVCWIRVRRPGLVSPRGSSCLWAKCPFGSLMVSSTRILAPVRLTASLLPIGVKLSAKAQWSRKRARSVRGWWARRSTGRTRARILSPFDPRARAWPNDWSGRRGCQRSREGGGLRAIVC